MIRRGETPFVVTRRALIAIVVLVAIAALSAIVRTVFGPPAEERTTLLEHPLAPALIATSALAAGWALAWLARVFLARREDHYIEDVEDGDEP